jgi:hypothetical protein
VLVAFVVTSLVLGQATTDPGGMAADLFKFGLTPVALVVLVITGWLVPRTTIGAKDAQIAMLEKQLAASEAQVAVMVANYQTQVIPTLTDVQRDLVPTLARAADQLKVAGQQLDRLRETHESDLAAVRDELRRLGDTIRARR